MLAVYSFAVSDVQAKKKVGKRCTKPQKDDEIKKEMERLLAIADANKPVEKEETGRIGNATNSSITNNDIMNNV
ncbi:unnamed protein product [Trichobilharzia szidati]|nr:unnamed protein product [Trichobilharzia szidati]